MISFRLEIIGTGIANQLNYEDMMSLFLFGFDIP